MWVAESHNQLLSKTYIVPPWKVINLSQKSLNFLFQINHHIYIVKGDNNLCIQQSSCNFSDHVLYIYGCCRELNIYVGLLEDFLECHHQWHNMNNVITEIAWLSFFRPKQISFLLLLMWNNLYHKQFSQIAMLLLQTEPQKSMHFYCTNHKLTTIHN